MRPHLLHYVFAIICLTRFTCPAQQNYERFWSPLEQHAEINDWFVYQRMIPYGRVDAAAHRIAANTMLQERKRRSNLPTAVWQPIGPVNVGGRITDVEMPANSMTTMYACGASGGIFKSIDAGINWTPIFDNQPSLSIGDLAIAPSNANVLYAGTGEPNSGGGSITYDGAGVFKSTDAGQTWSPVGLSDCSNIGRIAVHPSNPDIVFVAAMGDLFGPSIHQGLYRSADGGQTWQQTLYVNDSTGVIDVAIDPSNPDNLYACSWTRVRRIDRRNYGGPASGLWKSIDGGITWSVITVPSLPASFPYGRTSIGIAASNPNILYYLVSDRTSVFQGVYKSVDAGASWTRTNDSLLGDIFNGAAHWEGRIKVDPTNADIVYLVGFDTWKTTDGGQNWSNISGNYHPDNHEVFVHPMQHDLLLRGNDGGLYDSYDGGLTWNHNEGLPVTQFYTCEVDESNPDKHGGGAQDNGTQYTFTGANNDWNSIWGGDGFYTLIDQVSLWIYAEYQYGGINTGTVGVDPADRFNWNTPLAFNPQDNSTIYMGANRLYVSYDQGMNWQAISPDLTDHTLSGYPITWGTITTIAVAPSDTNVIYCGTDDGNVWVTTNHGGTWQPVDPMTTIRWVTRLAVDHSNAAVVYATLSGYRFHDAVAHVYRSADFGQHWSPIDGNLPDVPCNDIIPDAVHDSTLYLATDVGVFLTQDLGQHWTPAGSGMPVVPVCDLRMHQATATLYAGTYGRSMWSLPLNPIFAATAPLPTIKQPQAYPNPFHDRLFVNHIKYFGKIEEVLLADATGRITFNCKTPIVLGDRLDLSDWAQGLSPGSYFLSIRTDQGVAGYRLIKTD